MASSDPSDSRLNPKDEGQIGTTIQLIKDYARQETLGPLRGAARWLAAGALGAILYGLATVFLLLAALRFAQAQWDLDGPWSSLATYSIPFGIGLVVIVVAVLRISRQPLQKEDR